MNYKVNKNTGNRSKAQFAIAGVFVLIIIVSGYYFLVVRNHKSNDISTGTESADKLDLNPPTDEELKETEEFKKTLTNESQSSTNQSFTSDGLRSVIPVLGYLQQANGLDIESNGYISGIAETDGACTLTLEKDGAKVTETRQAMLDAQGMICGYMTINRDKLSQGSWRGYISYRSSKSSGISEQRTIEVK